MPRARSAGVPPGWSPCRRPDATIPPVRACPSVKRPPCRHGGAEVDRGAERMGRSSEDEFAEFYDATWSRTHACAYSLTGDIQVAEELAQEAYARAWARWSKL